MNSFNPYTESLVATRPILMMALVRFVDNYRTLLLLQRPSRPYIKSNWAGQAVLQQRSSLSISS